MGERNSYTEGKLHDAIAVEFTLRDSEEQMGATRQLHISEYDAQEILKEKVIIIMYP